MTNATTPPIKGGRAGPVLDDGARSVRLKHQELRGLANWLSAAKNAVDIGDRDRATHYLVASRIWIIQRGLRWV
jgi:hypothetical protein